MTNHRQYGLLALLEPEEKKRIEQIIRTALEELHDAMACARDEAHALDVQLGRIFFGDPFCP